MQDLVLHEVKVFSRYVRYSNALGDDESHLRNEV